MDLQLMFEARVEQLLTAPEMVWGRDDCCLFVADFIQDMCDVDLAAPFRDRYHSQEGAAAVLMDYAGGGLTKAACVRANELNLEETALQDVGSSADHLFVSVCVTKGGPMLGLWNGSGWLVRTENGVAVLPPQWMAIAWRVPTCHQQS